MEPTNVLAIPITLSALFADLNHRFLGLPTHLGIMRIVGPLVRRLRAP